MEINLDIVWQAPYFVVNCEWILSLWGLGFNKMENLSTTNDYFEGIDLSFNKIKIL